MSEKSTASAKPGEGAAEAGAGGAASSVTTHNEDEGRAPKLSMSTLAELERAEEQERAGKRGTAPAKPKGDKPPPEDPGAAKPKGDKPADDDPDLAPDTQGTDDDPLVPVRKSRLRGLQADRKGYRTLKEKIVEQAVSPKGPEAAPDKSKAPAPERVDPLVKARETTATARTELEKAQEALDAAQGEFKSAEEIKPLRKAVLDAMEKVADAKAEEKIIAERGRQAQERVAGSFSQQVAAAEEQHRETRDELWQQDKARAEAIGDPDASLEPGSPFYQAVDAQVKAWIAARNPIVTSPRLYRRAVEITADSLGIELPDAPAPAAKPKADDPPPEVVRRKTPGAVGGRDVLPGAQLTTDQTLEAFERMSPSQRLQVLAEIESTQERQKRTPRA